MSAQARKPDPPLARLDPAYAELYDQRVGWADSGRGPEEAQQSCKPSTIPQQCWASADEAGVSPTYKAARYPAPKSKPARRTISNTLMQGHRLGWADSGLDPEEAQQSCKPNTIPQQCWASADEAGGSPTYKAARYPAPKSKPARRATSNTLVQGHRVGWADSGPGPEEAQQSCKPNTIPQQCWASADEA
ncbi:MAG: hypothetical protein ACREPY_16890, partial [Rhodanobacteraceae bacterium]